MTTRQHRAAQAAVQEPAADVRAREVEEQMTARPATAVSENASDVAVARTRDRFPVQPPPMNPEGSPVPAFAFSTLDLPVHEQFGAWCDNLGYFLDLTGPDDPKKGFACQQVVWDLGHLAFAHIRHDASNMTRSARHIRRDSIDHWTLSLILQGSSRTIAPSREIRGDAGLVQVHPMGKVFEGRVAASDVLMLSVPRDFCRDTAYLLDAVEFSALRGGMGRLLADYMISLN